MSQPLPLDSRFYRLLLRLDQDLAEEARRSGCLFCGAVLHCANYPRKPRGAPADLDPSASLRLSFCCDACRRRRTPASVRFLGRKVYLGAVVMLVTALRQGASPPGLRRLKELLGVDRRTLARWREWWIEIFPRSRLWREVRGLVMPPIAARGLPLSLLESFGALLRRLRLRRVLLLLSPVTVPADYSALLLEHAR